MRAFIFAVLAILGIAACGTTEVKPTSEATKSVQPSTASVVSNLPVWYVDDKSPDPDAFFVVGTGVSRDLGMSIEKATLDAQNHIADRIAAEVDAFTKSYKQDVGTASDIHENTEQIVRKLVSEVDVSGYTVTNKKIIAEGSAFRTYIQLRYIRHTALGSAVRAVESREAALSKELDERKQLRKRDQVAKAPVKARPTALSQTDIVIKETLASPECKPLGLKDSTGRDDKAEEN